MSFVKNINSCNLFIGLYSAYLLLRAKESSTITGYLLLLIIAISLGYFIFIQFKMKQPTVLKWLNIVIYMFALYGFIYILWGETVHDYSGTVSKINYLKKIAASLLPIYPFYYFGRKGLLSLKFLKFWIPVFLIISIYSFNSYYNLLLQHAQEKGSLATEFTNNTSYLFVSILPLIFLRKKNLTITYIYIGICALFIVMGVKRGAIITGILCIFYYLYKQFFNAKGYKRYIFIFFSIIAIIIVGYYITEFINESNYFNYRLNNTLVGNVSGRDNLYNKLIIIFQNSNVSSMLFGHGADSTVYFTTLYAHNDWLEILTNQGILGIIIYLGYFFAFYRTWRKYRHDKIIGKCLGGILIVLFFETLFSMSYTQYTLFICIAYGYCAAYIQSMSKMKSIYVHRA